MKKIAFVPLWVCLLFMLNACVHKAPESQSFSPQTTAIIEQLYTQADRRAINWSIFEQGLGDSNEEVRKLAVLSLGRIGGAHAAERLSLMLADKSAVVRAATALALGISAEPDRVPLLIQAYSTESTVTVKKEMLLALGSLGGKTAAQFLNLQILRDDVADAAAQAIGLLATWHRNDLIVTPSLYTRLLKLSAMQKTKSLNAAFALTRIPWPKDYIDESAWELAINSAQAPAAKALLIKAWGRLPKVKGFAVILRQMSNSSIAVRIEAIRALHGFVDQPQVKAMLFDCVDRCKPALAAEAITALANTASPQVFEQLSARSKNFNYQWLKVSLFDAWLKRDRRAALQWSLNHVSPEDVVWLAKLIKELDKTEYQTERSRLLTWLQQTAKHRQQRWKHELPEAKEPEYPAQSTPDYEQVAPINLLKVEVVTNRGTMVFGFDKHAPYTAYHFIQRVRDGFYNGSLFSRVIPNFVAQGGEHQGDGSGHVGYTIREEISSLSHQPGTIGMATIGKDTGGAQFFINLAPNLHLDRHYTLFGKVISGFDVAQSLQLGDWIVTARVVDS
ncbi:peptidylprolyl isomerase [Pleionea sp. CnH1-48]|uniref:peptidylprolyl isomerase n=1 Tax=Pleionea sp. CnH1-48 TaxID=2954494 RepID=UPI0020972CEF|nr:peptidylprolyl isomerase [Pleionea sp. CnH1-48]MCO7225724.1 peptidylprolyl isomerase [Pleionea sp. CnH1-48]